MKATGIVRRIDDLGRIVIPKEIRKTLKVKEGMPLEIYTDRNGEIILKKYMPFSQMGVLAGEFADCVAGQTGDVVFVTDREKIIAVSGCPAKGLVGENISRNMERILDDRDEKLPQSERSRFIPVKEGMEETGQTWCLIRSEGEVVGMVILQNKDKKKKIGEMEKKIVSVAADFLGKQVSV